MDTSIPKRRCSDCKQLLAPTLKNFPPQKDGLYELSSICRKCYGIRKKQWTKNNPDKRKVVQDRYDRKRRERKTVLENIRISRKHNNGGEYTPEEIIELGRKQNMLCFYCNKDITDYYEIEHYVPLSRDGRNDISNIRLSCFLCNRSKGNRWPWEFKPTH